MGEDERRYFGTIKESHVRTVLWSFIFGLLGAIVWLAFDHRAQIGKSINYAVQEVTHPADLVRQFPLMQFGTLSQPTTILFMGTDVVYRDVTKRHRDVDASSVQGNTDTMMLVFLNPTRNTISVLNIPRDTEAYIGKWGVQKINSANPLGGPELAKATVASLLDVRIDHYAVMNVQGLVQLVNELGGITVEVPKKMNYMDWTAKLKIDLEPGPHTLTGNQAMGFVRFRHDALGDIGRIQRQQIFLQAAIRKMLNPASWMHVNALMEIAQRNTKTDMSHVEIFQALNFMHSVPRENTKFVMLPGDFGGNGDWLANTDAKALAQRLADPEAETVASRRNITVCIVNASSDRKLGGLLSKALRKLGYITCVGKDENEPPSNKTRIIAQNGNIANAKMMQQDLGGRGEVVNASVGNLMSSITIVAHDDIKLDEISMSSPDAPYAAPPPRPQPLVVQQVSTPSPSTDPSKEPGVPPPRDVLENLPDDSQQPRSIDEEKSRMDAESDEKLTRDDQMLAVPGAGKQTESNDKQTGGHSDRQNADSNDQQTGEHSDKQTGEHNDKQSAEHSDKQTGEHSDKQTGESASSGNGSQAQGTSQHSDVLPGKSVTPPPTAPPIKSEERVAEPFDETDKSKVR